MHLLALSACPHVYLLADLCLGFATDLLTDLRSVISTLRQGTNGVPQKGQVLLRLESLAVQPAMISSSYTRQSHVLQSEQLDISTCVYEPPQRKHGETRRSDSVVL